ncbi:MAG: NRDE family protein [Bacteroidia bacterium]
MCLILFAWQAHDRFPLIVAANRDEFYARPTQRAHWWEDHPAILAGKDLLAGGTWLGVSDTGRFSAVTNFREPHNIKADAPSRGALVSDFLGSSVSSPAYMDQLSARGAGYNGFNLLTFDGKSMGWYSNRAEKPLPLTGGIYGLSNHLLNTSWPKVEKGMNMLKQTIDQKDFPDREELFHFLADEALAPDENLPQTGVSKEWEKRLSAICIKSPEYGTRVSTVVMIDREGHVFFEERAHVPEGSPARFVFSARGGV